ncbi:MAG: hypothetical protein MI673_10235 [Thiotrichales bacterium]|nr:hypothetical protein [Thiotrichales bacterium]
MRCLIFILLSIFVAGCEDGPPDYYPLEEGYYWRYKMHYEIMNGPMDSFFALENREPVMGQQGLLYEQYTMDGKSYFYQDSAAGLLLLRQSRHLDFKDEYHETNRYLFKYPLHKGQQWRSDTWSRVLIKVGPPQKTEFRIVAQVPVSVLIESMTDTVTVPAGTFRNCMRVRTTGRAFFDAGNYVGKTVVGIDETVWYAPDIGMIKTVRRETTTSRALDYGEIILELEDYRSG